MDPAEPSRHRTRRPDPALAALLNLLAPGSAFVYAGIPLLAVPVALATLVLVGGAAWVSCRVTGRAIHIALMVWMAAVPLIAVPALGWWVASRQDPRVPRWFERWYVVLLTSLMIVVGLQLAARVVVFERVKTYSVNGRSMSLTLFDRERLVGCAIGGRDVPRRQVVSYEQVPDGGRPGRLVVGRIVAGPADTIRMQNYEAVINGAKEPPGAGPCLPAADSGVAVAVKEFAEVRVPEGHYYVLGDCRDFSVDSRQVGVVSRDRIRARIAWIWFSPWSADRVGLTVK
jgi:signal peptidase I